MTQLSTFVRITGARWLWPLLALVLLTEVWLARMAAVGNPPVIVLAVLLLSSAGLAGTVVLVYRLTRLVGEA